MRSWDMLLHTYLMAFATLGYDYFREIIWIVTIVILKF
jgi:hypothetical protein